MLLYRDNIKKLKYHLLVVALHIVQPVARLYGRIKFGLTPWRKRGAGWSSKYLLVLRNKTFLHWSEKWFSNEEYLTALEQTLINQQMIARKGGDFDRWDLQTGNKLFAYVRCLLTVEEHGAGKQYVKIKSTVLFPAFSFYALLTMVILTSLSFLYQHWIVGSVFGAFALLILAKCTIEKSNVLQSLQVAINGLPKQEQAHMVVVHKTEEADYVPTLNTKAKLLKLKLTDEVNSDVEKHRSLSQVHGV